MKHGLHLGLVAALAALALAGCAEQQAPINRVQPDYFDKAFFVGDKYQDASDDPEFYSQATLVDVGYGAGQDGLFTSTYAQPLSRVKWQVTENLLIARLAYERIKDSDGKGLGRATNDGIVVAAYPITSHFDIARQYNTQTGEQMNVIVENTQDRPWYERQYMRVDWSKNLSTDNYEFDTLSQMGVYGGVTYEPLAYAVLDPLDEDAPHFDAKQGYLDITNKAFARPLMVTFEDWGFTFPACFLDADFSGSAPTTQCSPVELTIRQSFRRVPDNDYEPEDWDGYRFQAFGAFTTDRKGYARQYGMTDAQWHRFINRYNIWERSHRYADPVAMTGPVSCFTPATTPAGADPHRDVDGDGTEDECAAAGSGSRCDTFTQKCTLPYREREVRPIVWYYSEGSNPEYFESSRDAAHEWDVAMRSAVVTARYAECARTHGADCESSYPVFRGQQDDNQDAIWLAKEVDDCRAGRTPVPSGGCEALADSLGAERGMSPGVIALARMPEMLVLCHSPVEAGDPGLCGGPRLPADLTSSLCFSARLIGDREVMARCSQALQARRGDLRYHMVNVITAPQTPSPWGIMVDAHDPLTGEKVSASVNVWSHVTDLWTRGIVDTARYVKGELTTADVTEGTYVRDWAKAAEGAGAGGALPHLTEEQQLRMVSRAAGARDLTQLHQQLEGFKGTEPFLAAKNLRRDLQSVRFDAYQSSTTRAVYESRRKRALDTPTEAALSTRTMQQLAGNASRYDTSTMLALSSPLRGANPSLRRELLQARELALAERGACIMNEAPAPLGIADLSNLLEAKFGRFDRNDPADKQFERAERARQYLAHRANHSVLVHEMGHSIALRHNFVSSSDAYNYRPQYWQLRTNNGAAQPCTDLDLTGACVGPRTIDPITQNERDNLLPMFMQSSTMDYAGESTQDLLGLGAYDFAAARMFYGDVTAVLTDGDKKAGSDLGYGLLSKMDNFGGILGISWEVRVPSGPFSAGDTEDVHYSQLQKTFNLIRDCQDVPDPTVYRPATWDESKDGAWHPVLDGLLVKVNGNYSKCRQMPVDYVDWDELRAPGTNEVGFARTNRAIDAQDRIRVPYGFATDRWADLGNLSVYRFDNGADPYELFDFLISYQEVNHIFDNYRRNRQTFSVRASAGRTLSRYNEKLRDAAKGLGLMVNIYRDFWLARGWDFDSMWPLVGPEFFKDNLLASGLGFDHFARQMARPEAGPHNLVDGVLRSNLDALGTDGAVVVNVPNGATGFFQDVSFGGRPLENALSEDHGEYDSEYTINAGSYYDKAYVPMLFTESVDNFISDSRRDFLDGRYRAVSMADLFPDGYRRWLSNALTGDDALKGDRVAASTPTRPLVDADGYPTQGLGYISWWKESPELCFRDELSLQCGTTPATSVVIDPQIGWEQQKFIIAMTLMYLPENAQQGWLDQLGIWELGADSDPGFDNRIELHLPNGKVYIARTYGKETILGETVQKGVAARMLEYANQLLDQAYETDPGLDLDGDGTADWRMPRYHEGRAIVRYDSKVQPWINDRPSTNGRPGCNASSNLECTCASNRACLSLEKYSEVPFFMRQAMRDYGLAAPSMRGIY